jgi:uncharacterized protein YkwD
MSAVAGVALVAAGGVTLLQAATSGEPSGRRGAAAEATHQPNETADALPTPATSPTSVPTTTLATSAPPRPQTRTNRSRTTAASRAKTTARTVTTRHTVRASQTTKATTTTKTTASSSGSSTYESQLLSLVNHERTSRGIAPLRAASCPDRFAESWAAHLSSTGAFSHQSLGPIMSTCGASIAAENIARGSISPSTMVRLWMNSASHRDNILDPKLTQVGTAAVKNSSGEWTAVQDFIRP